MRKTTLRYWICQILGWGGWTSLTLFFIFLYASDVYLKPPQKRNVLFGVLLIELLCNIFSTHLLRYVLKKINWIRFSINRVIILFVIAVTLTGLLSYYGAKTTAVLTGYSLIQYEKNQDLQTAITKEKELNLFGTDYYKRDLTNPKDSLTFAAVDKIKRNTGWYRDKSGNWKYEDQNRGRYWWDLIFTFILIALWLLLYMVWHYLERNRRDEIDKISLEKTVKELELKTIKSHINPHFIFNALNSIRALVDENPQRARTSITELSNILRSSMQVEKMETVPLEKELAIVNDYLALEHMRFEERLRVDMEIDPDSLEQPVPPMMLQTLVENAIKHGISKKINGGLVKIISKFTDDHFELIVRNNGPVNEDLGEEGFGIKSTRDRIKMLYQGKADFQIKRIGENEIEAKVVLPAMV
jgi:two-component sensor histidine kinase